jgi:anhydro-N-acetylmuramic acid kinase
MGFINEPNKVSIFTGKKHGEMNIYKIIGLMSGTSLDGLDIAYCEFIKNENGWHYEIKHAETFVYDTEWKERLSNIVKASSQELMIANVALGKLFGQLAHGFIKKYQVSPELIASHGHTVFHQPENGFTLQIGSGYEILNACNIKVVCDFRSLDVSLGGQGAPLVPIGDKLLFKEYDFCLNLGGISNISFDVNGRRRAYDIAPHNIIMNRLARQLGREYDDKGKTAASGKMDNALWQKLNGMDYYSKKNPKSLGIEYLEKHFLPVLEEARMPVEDKMNTFAHHVACQIDKEIKKVLPMKKKGQLLVTGGGAFNDFFITLLRQYSAGNYDVQIPDERIINFKEALVFAFLGVLRLRGEVNALKSVTGAQRDSCTGVVLELLPMP